MIHILVLWMMSINSASGINKRSNNPILLQSQHQIHLETTAPVLAILIDDKCV